MDDIFVSYSTKDSQVQVQCIKAALKDRGFRLITDTETIKSYLSIKEFMNKIPKGSAVLIFVSQAYFKSDYCLYELSQIWKSAEQSRMFPVFSGDFTLGKVERRLKLGEELENRISKLREKFNASIKKNRPLPDSAKILQCFEYLRARYDEILFFLSDTASTMVGGDLTYTANAAVDLIEERLKKDRAVLFSNMDRLGEEFNRLKTTHEERLARDRFVGINYYENDIYISTAGEKYRRPNAYLQSGNDTPDTLPDILVDMASELRASEKTKLLEILIGPAGSGKSSMLIEMCKSKLNDEDWALYFDLRHFSGCESTLLEDFIYSEMFQSDALEQLTRIRSFADTMEVFANIGARLIIMLDEFDQLDHSVQTKLLQSMVIFIDRWKKTQCLAGIVLATRPGTIIEAAGYTDKTVLKRANNVYYLSPWDGCLRQSYIDGWETGTGIRLATSVKNVFLTRSIYDRPLMLHLALCLAGNSDSEFSISLSGTSLLRNYIRYMAMQSSKWNSELQSLLQTIAWCNATEVHKTYERFGDAVLSEWSEVYGGQYDTWRLESFFQSVGEIGLFRIDASRVVFIHNEIQDYLAAVHLFEVSKANMSIDGHLMLPARYLKVVASWGKEKYRSICRMFFKIGERTEGINAFLYEQIFLRQSNRTNGLGVPPGEKSAAKFIVSILAEGAEYIYWNEIVEVSLAEHAYAVNACAALFSESDSLAGYVSDLSLLMSVRSDIAELVIGVRKQGKINEAVLECLPAAAT